MTDGSLLISSHSVINMLWSASIRLSFRVASSPCFFASLLSVLSPPHLGSSVSAELSVVFQCLSVLFCVLSHLVRPCAADCCGGGPMANAFGMLLHIRSYRASVVRCLFATQCNRAMGQLGTWHICLHSCVHAGMAVFPTSVFSSRGRYVHSSHAHAGLLFSSSAHPARPVVSLYLSVLVALGFDAL